MNVLGQQGFLLNRYLAYEVTSDVRPISVSIIYVLIDVPNSEEHLCLGATQSSSSYGIVSSSGTRSDCFQHYLRNEWDVSDVSVCRSVRLSHLLQRMRTFWNKDG